MQDIFNNASLKLLWLIEDFEILLFLSNFSCKTILQMAKPNMNLLIVVYSP